MLRRFRGISIVVLMVLRGTAIAQVDPLSGIDFVTISDVGNPNWNNPEYLNHNRGRVNYEYRIGRFEVTTSQWAEFMNAALDRPANDRIPHVIQPYAWQAEPVSPQNGGSRWRVAAGDEMLPAGGITWRTAAIYCNWLHNGKGTNRSAFLTGAYDVSTFGYQGTSALFTDQLTRSPGARYWIPGLDEWIKAAHWDPRKVNADGSTGGWWQYSNTSDEPYVYGPPGVRVIADPFPRPDPNGQLSTANAGWDPIRGAFPGLDPYLVPLGAYPSVQSPWGLLDVAGGTAEWTEEVAQLRTEPLPRERYAEGSSWFRHAGGFGGADFIGQRGAGSFPNLDSYNFGLRVAAQVPSPGFGLLATVALMHAARRRRIGHEAWNVDSGGRDGVPATIGSRSDHRISNQW